MLRISKAWKKRLAARSPDPVLPERFREARKRLRWTPEQAGDFLWVSGRTIRNWEAGRGRIPYAAFRLLRLRSGHAVSATGWDGWQFAASGGLVSPSGRVFHSYQLEQIERVFAQAELWRGAHGRGLGLPDRGRVLPPMVIRGESHNVYT